MEKNGGSERLSKLAQVTQHQVAKLVFEPQSGLRLKLSNKPLGDSQGTRKAEKKSKARIPSSGSFGAQ